jgi:ribonuclease BN (tRNA processing enzyme)
MPTGERMQTGLLIESEASSPLLVDCGSGVLHRLAQTECGYEGVAHVLLTHHHLDHVSDLMVLLKARWLAGHESLTIAGPVGTVALVDGLLEVHDYLQDRLELNIKDVEGGTFEFAGYRIQATETVHSAVGLAYRLQADGGTLTFSGDSEATDDLAAFAHGSDILVHDCSFPDAVDVSNHPTPSQLGRALAGHEYGVVYLSHLYPHTDGNRPQMLDSLAKSYNGDVRFAPEGETIQVSSD